MLCCETYSFHSQFKRDSLRLEDVPMLFRRLEIAGIAWNDLYFSSWDQAYLDALNDATRSAGRRTMCFIMEGNLATADEEVRTRQLEENTRKLHAAKYLGAPVVRMNLGKTERPDLDGTVGVQRCIAAFHQLLPVARELGIKMTIENHGGPSTKADWILEIIRATDQEWVGSCLDFGNWPADPAELRYEEIEKLAPYAYHTHVKTHAFLPNGEAANVDYQRCFKIMKSVHYTRAVSIEWEGQDPADPAEGVKLTRDLILKHWPETVR